MQLETPPVPNNNSNVSIEQLAASILHHKRLYYAGHPQISDQKFDELEKRLVALAPDHPALSFVGSEPTSLNTKVSHSEPMLSLAKTYEISDLVSWINDRETLALLKIDGNSLSLIFEDGRLRMAKTRGDGRVGEDVTDKAVWVPEIPKNIPLKGKVEVRGELYCALSHFAKLSESMKALGLERPTSPRNIVAGVLGRKNFQDLASFFSFFAFDLIADNLKIKDLETESGKLDLLNQWGFRIPNPQVLKDSKDLQNYVDQALVAMDDGEYGIDGIVIVYNALSVHRELGSTSHHPRYKLSFKWQGETAETKIIKIEWFTSRLGIVTPVAVVEPVVLSGATIQNVTLHNALFVKTYGLCPGLKIEIIRSGEVIPKFLRVIGENNLLGELVENCPSCSSELQFDGVRLNCPLKHSCPAQRLGQILNWIRAVEIDDLSEKRLSAMIEIGLIKSIPDLYRLTIDDILKLPSTGEKLAAKLFANIQKTKSVEASRYLTGLGIAGLGRTSFEKLLSHFCGLKDLLSADEGQIIEVDGFAEKTARSLVEGLNECKNLFDELERVGVKPYYQSKSTRSGPLAGKTFVITGTLSKPRDEISDWIKERGGMVTSAVSKNTTAVISEDENSSSSKAKKAVQLGIPIWKESELVSLTESN